MPRAGHDKVQIFLEEQPNGAYTKADMIEIYTKIVDLKNKDWKLGKVDRDDWIETAAIRTRLALRHLAQVRSMQDRVCYNGVYI